jgi:hypothetical protein
MLPFRLVIALIFLKILSLCNTHHIQVKLGGIHQLRTLETLLFEVIIGRLSRTQKDASSVNKQHESVEFTEKFRRRLMHR